MWDRKGVIAMRKCCSGKRRWQFGKKHLYVSIPVLSSRPMRYERNTSGISPDEATSPMPAQPPAVEFSIQRCVPPDRDISETLCRCGRWDSTGSWGLVLRSGREADRAVRRLNAGLPAFVDWWLAVAGALVVLAEIVGAIWIVKGLR